MVKKYSENATPPKKLCVLIMALCLRILGSERHRYAIACDLINWGLARSQLVSTRFSLGMENGLDGVLL